MTWKINAISNRSEIGNYIIEQLGRWQPKCRRGGRFLEESGSVEISCIICSNRKDAARGLIKSTRTLLFEI